MSHRIITGKIYKSNDEPWINAYGNIKLIHGSYDGNIHYPEFNLLYCTDETGEVLNIKKLPLILWCNEEGYSTSYYQFVLPDNKSFDFTLPSGSSSIEISVLRENINSSNSNYQSIINYVDNEISLLTGTATHYEIFNVFPQNTIINLSEIPINPTRTQVFFNGLKQRLGIDYIINSLILNIVRPLPVPYTIEIYY